jgi:UDP:flavonoid glycosyltransferase YjiC (YdhE family)
MRFLFISAPLPGHLDWGGYLATAVELQRRGHEILWASGQAVAARIQQAAIPFHALQETGWRWPPPPPLPLLPDLSPTAIQQLRAERALDQWLDETRVSQACQEIIELGRTYQPTLLVSEMFVSAAGLVAEVLGLPFVVAGWPAMQPKVAADNAGLSSLARARLQRLLAQFNISGRNWTSSGPPGLCSPTRHLTYWSPTWYRGVALLPQTQHVGGRAPEAVGQPPEWPADNPWVFITLGTSFGDDLNFFIAAARAAAELGCLPVVALGGQLAAAQRQLLQEQIPSTTIIEEMLDLDAVLPYMAAAIHHGGAGTTHALITHGVPQIIVPHAADQSHQAQGVARSGVGFALAAKETTIPRLVNGLAQLLPDLSPYRAQAQLLQTEFAALGGVQTAARLLVEAAEQGI